jgi:hypothetical protein
MDASDVTGFVGLQHAMRERWSGLQEHQRWVHHAVDLERGEILTTPLERPIWPRLRADRLSELGHRVDATVFGGQFYRLTPSRPYQASPEAWLEVSGSSYYAAAGDVIWWEPPREFDPRSLFLGLLFDALVAPSGRLLASISLSGHSFEGTVGYLELWARGTGTSVNVPVDSTFAARTVDFIFGPYDVPTEPEIGFAVLPGVQLLTFSAFSFGTAPPVGVGPGSISQ